MAERAGLAPGHVRPGGVYARVGDEWMLSTQTWVGHTNLPWVELRPSDGGVPFRVSPEQVQTAIRVRPEVEYAGYWFDLGSLWTASRERIWTVTDTLNADCFADLLYHGDHPSEVGALPGARVQSGRGDMGGVALTVRLSDVTGYRETVQEVTVAASA